MYKLVTIQDEGHWEPAIKLSETPAKTINPGHKQVWRVYDARGKTTADLLALDDEDPRHMERLVLHHPTEEQTQRVLEAEDIEKNRTAPGGYRTGRRSDLRFAHDRSHAVTTPGGSGTAGARCVPVDQPPHLPCRADRETVESEARPGPRYADANAIPTLATNCKGNSNVLRRSRVWLYDMLIADYATGIGFSEALKTGCTIFQFA